MGVLKKAFESKRGIDCTGATDKEDQVGSLAWSSLSVSFFKSRGKDTDKQVPTKNWGRRLAVTPCLERGLFQQSLKQEPLPKGRKITGDHPDIGLCEAVEHTLGLR